MTKHYILAADDEPMNQMILEELLEGDYELVCVDNGVECVESVKKRRPDLILMDINMPEMDGLEACRQIKVQTEMANLPIIMVSALASETEIEIGLAAGGDAYISKPFDEEKLFETIKQYLG